MERRRIALAELDGAELQATIEQQIADYAATKVRAGQWSSDDALARSRDHIQALVAAPGHRFWKGLDEAGRRIGWVWVGPPPAGVGAYAYLYQITVDAGWRGRGYGEGLLAAVEQRLTEEGVPELWLNVFMFNTPALRLYERMGYQLVEGDARASRLRKPLAPPA